MKRYLLVSIPLISTEKRFQYPDRRLFDADMPMDELVSAIYLLNKRRRCGRPPALFCAGAHIDF